MGTQTDLIEPKKIQAGIILSKKAKTFLHEHRWKFRFISFILVIGLALCIGVVNFVLDTKTPKTNPIINNSKTSFVFSYQEKYNKYKQNFVYYKTKATTDEILYSFVTVVSDFKYKLGGKWNNKLTDCTGAVNLFFRYWGANFVLENVESISTRIRTLRQKGALEKRLIKSRIHQGDIIIFLKKKKPSHIAIVYKVTPSGRIQYMDMNLHNKSWGLNVIDMWNKKIEGIYEVSLELWMGDFFKNKK